MFEMFWEVTTKGGKALLVAAFAFWGNGVILFNFNEIWKQSKKTLMLQELQ